MASTPQTPVPRGWPRRRLPSILVRSAAHIGALVPGFLLAWDAATGGLSVDPVKDLTQRTGKDAFVLLVLSLAVGPAVRLTGLRIVAPLARILGLYAFGYATLHLLTFVGLDFGFRGDLIVDGVLEKRFAVIGSAAFLILLILAATSTRGWSRRLGPLWKRIHRLAYVAGALATLHYLWAVKTIMREQLIWALVVGVLLALRLPEADRLFGLARRKPTADGEPQEDSSASML
ncbi:MAG TPA: protein-methionine-sulfoxide reductase heme-binding subunit MsrQ [Thermoleophilia bacterium]|nr:protein-methionine-sulfoxide reductase heme-binding subunit MsrQ [Thermoleophilia bacterium]